MALELGFESVWVPEHLVLPIRFESRYPYSEDGLPPLAPDTPHLDPLVLLTHIAATTSRIRLGTNIFILALRHPLVTARMAVSLDVLSGGRLSLGIGAGWLEEKFRAAGVEFRTRGAHPRVRAGIEPPILFGGETETALPEGVPESAKRGFLAQQPRLFES